MSVGFLKSIFKVILLLIISSNLSLANEQQKSKKLYLEYDLYPKRVFTKQKFDITYKAVVLYPKSKYDKILTTTTLERDITILTPDIVWKERKSNRFTASMAFKVNDKEFTLPTVTLALIKDEEVMDFITIKPPKIKYEKRALKQKLFSNIIASKLEVNTVKTKQYTNKILHTTIHISAKNSNIEDIKIGTYKEQSVESFEEVYPLQDLYYSIMVPIHTKEIKFSYYNTKQKSFVTIRIPMILDEELVSTQTELNPYHNSLLVYKQYLVAGFVFICLVLFLFTKKTRYNY